MSPLWRRALLERPRKSETWPNKKRKSNLTKKCTVLQQKTSTWFPLLLATCCERAAWTSRSLWCLRACLWDPGASTGALAAITVLPSNFVPASGPLPGNRGPASGLLAHGAGALAAIIWGSNLADIHDFYLVSTSLTCKKKFCPETPQVWVSLL